MSEVLVIGGGAAGIIAAVRAAECGAQVTLLEKNAGLGMKILISGGGKCNLTHAGTVDDIRRGFRTGEALFLKPALHRYTNERFLDLLHSRGLATYARPDGRVFPVEPANAKDVVALLTRIAAEAGVRIRYNCPVTGIVLRDGSVAGVQTSSQPSSEKGDVAQAGQFLPATSVIVCTGGSSYPATGTTGDGWQWLTLLGHSIVPLRAALAPIYLRDAKPDWSGIALRDITLKARGVRSPSNEQEVGAGSKELSRWTGDLLFTHKGISGPAALAVSRDVSDYLADTGSGSAVRLEADLAPARPYESVQEELRAAVQPNPRATAVSLAQAFVPARLGPALIEAASIDPTLRLSGLSAKALNRLVATVKGWPLGEVRLIPLERGEVVAGGVALEEVDSRTMESKKVRGLYLCGELLDIAGAVGGYNLQAAWSTGYVAGESAAERAKSLPAN